MPDSVDQNSNEIITLQECDKLENIIEGGHFDNLEYNEDLIKKFKRKKTGNNMRTDLIEWDLRLFSLKLPGSSTTSNYCT